MPTTLSQVASMMFGRRTTTVVPATDCDGFRPVMPSATTSTRRRVPSLWPTCQDSKPTAAEARGKAPGSKAEHAQAAALAKDVDELGRSTGAVPMNSAAETTYVSEEEEATDLPSASDSEAERPTSASSTSNADQWKITLKPPSTPPQPTPRYRSSDFDGHWVLQNFEPGISEWLRSLTINGDEVRDALNNTCHVVHTSTGPVLSGGALYFKGDLMVRVGKTGRVQEYRRSRRHLSVKWR